MLEILETVNPDKEVLAACQILKQKGYYLALSLEQMEEIIKKDVSLSFKLFRYVNSAWSSLRSPVRSLRQAMILLGEKGLKRWLALLTISNLTKDRPPALLTTCAIRGRFCELIAAPARLIAWESPLFLTGLFSALDSLVGRPLEEVLEEIGAAQEVRLALSGHQKKPGRNTKKIQESGHYWIKILNLRFKSSYGNIQFFS